MSDHILKKYNLKIKVDMVGAFKSFDRFMERNEKYEERQANQRLYKL